MSRCDCKVTVSMAAAVKRFLRELLCRVLNRCKQGRGGALTVWRDVGRFQEGIRVRQAQRTVNLPSLTLTGTEIGFEGSEIEAASKIRQLAFRPQQGDAAVNKLIRTINT